MHATARDLRGFRQHGDRYGTTNFTRSASGVGKMPTEDEKKAKKAAYNKTYRARTNAAKGEGAARPRARRAKAPTPANDVDYGAVLTALRTRRDELNDLIERFESFVE